MSYLFRLPSWGTKSFLSLRLPRHFVVGPEFHLVEVPGATAAHRPCAGWRVRGSRRQALRAPPTSTRAAGPNPVGSVAPTPAPSSPVIRGAFASRAEPTVCTDFATATAMTATSLLRLGRARPTRRRRSRRCPWAKGSRRRRRYRADRLMK